MSDLPLCVKTPKGIVEVEHRTYRLPMRMRQALIMIDGKRDHATLSAMFPGDGLAGILDHLLSEGFITPLRREEPAPPRQELPASAAAPVPAKPAEAKRPSAPAPANDDERYAMARNFMINTTGAFVGIAGSSLTNRIEAAPSIDDLRHLFDEWREAIQLSRDGRKQIADLEGKLAALLS